MIVQFGDPRLPPRFWDKCVPEPMSGCWLWTGTARNSGYGNFSVGGRADQRMWLAHRYVYEMTSGALGALTIDHLCCVKLCCNPAHMEPVTLSENVNSRIHAERRAMTHCRRGHAFEGNVIWRRGSRRCRTCDQSRRLEYEQRKRGR